jgi:hypothetical protein
MKTIASHNGLRGCSLAALLAACTFQAWSALAVEPDAVQRTDSDSWCCSLLVGESALHLPGEANTRGRSIEGIKSGSLLLAWDEGDDAGNDEGDGFESEGTRGDWVSRGRPEFGACAPA